MTPFNKKYLELNLLLLGIALKEAEICEDEEHQTLLIQKALLKAQKWEILSYLETVCDANDKFSLDELNRFLKEVKIKLKSKCTKKDLL